MAENLIGLGLAFFFVGIVAIPVFFIPAIILIFAGCATAN